jgi:tripartite-type tricarboxylate transporter receptor subunit TctC
VHLPSTTIFKRPCLGLTGLAIVGMTCTGAALAQPYPAKPVKIIVPYAAAGGTDILSRIVADKLTQALGQSFIVENRPGANGVIGSEQVAKSAPDGHTLMVVVGTHVINPYLQKKVPYDPLKDFAPVTLIATSPMVIVAGLQQPFNDVKSLIAYARTNPGKLSIGNSEAVTMLSGELFKSLAKLDMTPVAYKGGGPLMTDVIGGHIPTGVTSLTTSLQHYKSGKLRVLGVGSTKRSSAMPDVPTVIEAGLPGYEAVSIYGMLAPAGTPPAIVRKLQQEIHKSVADPAVRERFAGLGADAVGSTPEEFGAFLKSESDKWGRIIKDIGLQPTD